MLTSAGAVTGVGTPVKEAHAQSEPSPVKFIKINLNGTLNPGDTPFGIECGDPNFVYVTIFEQGLLAKISKTENASGNHQVQLIDDPDLQDQPFGQHFYSIVRDPNTGDLFINEVDNGKAWRFDPTAPLETAWTRIPLLPKIVHPNVTYPFTYPVRPNVMKVDERFAGLGFQDIGFQIPNRGGVVFANGFIWITLTFSLTFDDAAHSIGLNDNSFSGVVRVDPVTLNVTRFSIPSAGELSTPNVDFLNGSMIWIPDKNSSRVYRFDTSLGQVVQTVKLPEGSEPNHIATSDKSIFVALQIENPFGDTGVFSEIAQIDRSTPEVINIINTTAPNTFEGTFSVFFNNGLLVFTDVSGHVGFIDLTTGKRTVFDTVTTQGNHFGCVPKDGEFWFAGQGSAHVGIVPNSQFIAVRPTGRFSGGIPVGAGGYDSNAIVDTTPPSILDYNWKPKDASAGSDITIYADIADDVGVDKAVVFYYGPGEDYRDARSVYMSNYNPEWYTAIIPGSNVTMPNVSFWIVAMDATGNSAKTNTTVIDVQKEAPAVQIRSSVTSLPTSVLQAIKPRPAEPVQELEVISMNSGKEINTFYDTIMIRNTGSITADNIRIMLSPEIAKSFRLSDYAINSIKPHSNVTISLEHTGGQNRDLFGALMGYEGSVMVMGEHLIPIVLPVNIDAGGPYAQGSKFVMHKLPSMEGQRFIQMLSNGKMLSNSKISLINSLLSNKQKTQYDYEVTTSSGNNVITSPNGELTIKNLSGKELKNVRIYLSSLGRVFLPDQNVIQYLKPDGEVTIKLIGKGSVNSNDIDGGLLIVPSNDKPIEIPVKIAGEKPKNSADEFTAVSGSNAVGSNTITTAVDKITIKNLGTRSMDSVKLMLSGKLSSIFSLDEDSLQKIAPGEQVTVQLRYNAGGVKTLLQEYEGELTIVSEHHNMQSIPIKMEWNKLESKHFTVYARSGDEQVAKQVVTLLEANYQKITSRFGEVKTKTVIYITNSIDEMKLVSPSGHPYYSYAEDKIFTCTCDEPKYNAMKEFLNRLILNNYAAYYNMKKIILDKENWLLDGITTYVAAEMTNTGMTEKYIAAFTNDPTGFQWYGYGSDAEYGAAYTFFKFLEDDYGNHVIDKILHYLGSGMISNHRCSTLENCAVLRAAYDTKDWRMNDGRYSLSFSDMEKAWERQVMENYGADNLSIIERFVPYLGQYDLSGLNAFQKYEACKALAEQSAGLPLTHSELSILDLAKSKSESGRRT